MLGNVYHIDTEGWKDGYFTFLDLESLQAWPRAMVTEPESADDEAGQDQGGSSSNGLVPVALRARARPGAASDYTRGTGMGGKAGSPPRGLAGTARPGPRRASARAAAGPPAPGPAGLRLRLVRLGDRGLSGGGRSRAGLTGAGSRARRGQRTHRVVDAAG